MQKTRLFQSICCILRYLIQTAVLKYLQGFSLLCQAYDSFKMKTLVLLILTTFPIVSFSITLEDQLKQIEAKNVTIDEALKDVDENVYGAYIKEAAVTFSKPNIESLNGNNANVRISVKVRLDKELLNKIQHTILKYLEAEVETTSEYYGKDELFYRCPASASLQWCNATSKSRYSSDVWKNLSEKALGIEVNFLGQSAYHILIGQTLGPSGSVFSYKDIEFNFNVPMEKIKGDPQPIFNYVLYGCKWHYSHPSYSKISSRPITSKSIIQ